MLLNEVFLVILIFEPPPNTAAIVKKKTDTTVQVSCYPVAKSHLYKNSLPKPAWRYDPLTTEVKVFTVWENILSIYTKSTVKQ